jgi:hypothetical protein
MKAGKARKSNIMWHHNRQALPSPRQAQTQFQQGDFWRIDGRTEKRSFCKLMFMLNLQKEKRRGRDSNPRYRFTLYDGLANQT